MTLKFNIIPHEEITSVMSDSFAPGCFDEYIADRPNILTDVDIFCENYRSNDQHYKNFNLFERSDNPDVWVFSTYLELFEYENKTHMYKELLDHYSNKYDKVVCTWNHDNDWIKHGPLFEQYDNVYVTNFGHTSKKHKCDILLPFWVINTKPYKEQKKLFASFIGNPNNSFRAQLAQAIINAKNPKFVYGQVPYEQYLKTLSSSIFSLCPRGGGGSGGFSYRFFECFHLNTIPVIFSDKTIFPYDDIDWNDICVKIPEKYIDDIQEINNILESKDYNKMLKNIDEVKERMSLKGVQEKVYDILTG